jgi:undecaprenyl-diphosphatase
MKSFGNWVKNILFLLVYLFSGGTLLLIIDGISTGNELTPFNTVVENVVVHFRTPILTEFFITVTNIGSPFILASLSLVLAIYLLLRRDTYDALLYISAIALTVLTSTILKHTFQITRPIYGLVSLSSWSFPSGHATVSTAFFFATVYTFWGKIKSWPMRLLLLLGCITGAVLVSFSRLYLGVHYALDVLGGIALGLCSVSMIILIFNIFIEEEKWRFKRRSDRI